VVGARPQIIKAETVKRAIEDHNRKVHKTKIEEILVHTGQHYDYAMSNVFFEEMQIPHSAENVRINSCNHLEITGRMLLALECDQMILRPD
jgi:UDP-GlcNAc3NAcA epimerase